MTCGGNNTPLQRIVCLSQISSEEEEANATQKEEAVDQPGAFWMKSINMDYSTANETTNVVQDCPGS